MASNAWQIVDSFKFLMADGNMDLNADTFKCMLLTSEFTPSTSTLEKKADITSGICADADYGEVTLTTVTWDETNGTVTFDADDITFGTSVDLTAQYAVIYDDTMATTSYADAIVCFCALSSAADSAVTSTNGTFEIQLHDNGIFTM